ncbi:hypothetical protein BD289DRAFT_455556 [Coniella lustricola]|uniref:Uncharacterized protein n=1 Tax=Coniella lustricola TaxID=2025994 RepID=A0A2T2ZZF1_9PEZI|nr:hypothetical protein BD289DRAFT_455556 [Coniella lustricola]
MSGAVLCASLAEAHLFTATSSKTTTTITRAAATFLRLATVKPTVSRHIATTAATTTITIHSTSGSDSGRKRETSPDMAPPAASRRSTQSMDLTEPTRVALFTAAKDWECTHACFAVYSLPVDARGADLGAACAASVCASVVMVEAVVVVMMTAGAVLVRSTDARMQEIPHHSLALLVLLDVGVLACGRGPVPRRRTRVVDRE